MNETDTYSQHTEGLSGSTISPSFSPSLPPSSNLTDLDRREQRLNFSSDFPKTTQLASAGTEIRIWPARNLPRALQSLALFSSSVLSGLGD